MKPDFNTDGIRGSDRQLQSTTAIRIETSSLLLSRRCFDGTHDNVCDLDLEDVCPCVDTLRQQPKDGTGTYYNKKADSRQKSQEAKHIYLLNEPPYGS